MPRTVLGTLEVSTVSCMNEEILLLLLNYKQTQKEFAPGPLLFNVALNVSTNISLKSCFLSMFRSGMAGLGRHFYPRFVNEETEAQRTPATSRWAEGCPAFVYFHPVLRICLICLIPALTWKIGD